MEPLAVAARKTRKGTSGRNGETAQAIQSAWHFHPQRVANGERSNPRRESRVLFKDVIRTSKKSCMCVLSF